MPPRQKAKQPKPMRTVASVASAVHAIATAVTAASAASVHRVKKVRQTTPTTALLVNTKRSKKRKSHAHLGNLAVNAKNATNALTVRLDTRRVKMQRQRQKVLHALACHVFNLSPCPWTTCKPWPKAAVWNGSTPTQNVSLRYKPPSPRSPSPCMCHVSVPRW